MGKTRGLGFQKERWCQKGGFLKREVVPERRGPAKNKATILAGGTSGRRPWRCTGWRSGDAQGPWPVRTVTGDRADRAFCWGPGEAAPRRGSDQTTVEKTKWGKISDLIGSKINPRVPIYHGLLLALSHPWPPAVVVPWQNITQGLWLVSHCVKAPATEFLQNPSCWCLKGWCCFWGPASFSLGSSASSCPRILYTVQAAAEMRYLSQCFRFLELPFCFSENTWYLWVNTCTQALHPANKHPGAFTELWKKSQITRSHLWKYLSSAYSYSIYIKNCLLLVPHQYPLEIVLKDGEQKEKKGKAKLEFITWKAHAKSPSAALAAAAY